MIFNFLVLSDEVDNFRREIIIDSESTFHDLYKVLVKSLDYNEEEISSFFMCGDDWRRKQEITLVEMDTDSDIDIYVMDETPLIDFIEEEGQKMVFVFDYLNDRALYIKLSEIVTGKSLKKAQCAVSVGEAPPQYMDVDDVPLINTVSDMDETFFGDEGYNLDELDESGFESLDNLESLQ